MIFHMNFSSNINKAVGEEEEKNLQTKLINNFYNLPLQVLHHHIVVNEYVHSLHSADIHLRHHISMVSLMVDIFNTHYHFTLLIFI